MSSIVKNTNKKTGITYVYESESYWDPVKKQPRNRRKLIGKLDENGELVPTGRKGRPRSKDSTRSVNDETFKELQGKADEYFKMYRELELENKELRREIEELKKERQELAGQLSEIVKKYLS